MNKKIIIDANFPNETRVVLLSNTNAIEDIGYETSGKNQIKGNIYLAKISRVEPSLQSAFIEYGSDKSGFLPFNEVHPDYYNIPVSDKKPSISNLREITPPKITSDDLVESDSKVNYDLLNDTEEIDIEKLADEKFPLDFDLDVSDTDIEHIASDKAHSTEQQKIYKIQEVLKKGQILLVQVTKEERGNKGASFTTYISLAGKYCVLMPNKPLQNGVSRKISNAEERKRLKNIISKITADNANVAASVIARTAGIGHSTLEIKRDYDYLVRLWNKIREATLKATAPSFIHEEDGIIQKTIRDMFDHNVKELIVQGSGAYQSAIKFMRDILPNEVNKVKEYKNKAPIFAKFEIEDKLSSLYQPVVYLPSGGYIVINPTEALISIDVNSGRATSERNIEETALKTNLEAAKELSKQIKLRDLSGLLVIDFIDMYEAKNRKIVERSFKEFLSRDRARIQTTSISAFGLLEMSRQRMRPSFLEANSSICLHCNGKGVVRADESNAMLILRTIENEIFDENVDIVNVFANIHPVIYLLNNKRSEINLIEEKYNIKLNFNSDPNATSDSYSIEKIKLPRHHQKAITTSKPALNATSETYQGEAKKNKHRQKWKHSENTAEPKHTDVEDTDNANDIAVIPETVLAANPERKPNPKRKNRSKNKMRKVKEEPIIPTTIE